MNRREGRMSFLILALVSLAFCLDCGSEKSSEPDTTPPAAVDDLIVRSTGCDNVSLTWTAPGDDGSEGKASSYDVRYAEATITEGNWSGAAQCSGEPTPKTAGQTEALAVGSLEPGKTYYFAVKTTDDEGNESGLSNVCHSLIASSNIAWVNDGLGSDEDWVVSLSELSANWADAACVDGYEYSIGTTQGGTEVIGWTSSGSATHVTRSDLTLQDDHTYYFSARSVVGSNKGTPNSSDGITVDYNVPNSWVNALPAEVTTLTFTVSWTGNDATSGIKHYDIQVKDGDGAWTDWLVPTVLDSSNYNGTDGHIYYFRSRAWDNAGNYEAYPATADAQTTVNLAGKPQVAWVRDGLFTEADWTNSTTSLSAEWAPVAGGYIYEYAIGTAAGGTNVVDWTSVGTATQVTRSGLVLAEGQIYYFSVRVAVGVAHGDPVSSDGITVDVTLPTSSIDPLPPVVTTERYMVTWTGSDALSGIEAYNVQYLDGDGEWGDIYGWNPATSFNFLGEDGHTYYFRSRAFDRAGNAEAFPDVPDAQTTFMLPPVPDIAWVNDGMGADEDWTNCQIGDENVGLSANWASVLAVDGYQYAIGTFPGDTAFYSWNMGPVVTDTFRSESEPSYEEGETYYWSVRAVIGSRHGNPTCSDGVSVDRTPPASSVESLPDETNTLTFKVSWSGTDALSGLSNYTIQVSENSIDYVDWLVGTDLTSEDFTGEDGHRYYFQSRAADNAGNREAYPAGADAYTTVKCTYVFNRKWGTQGSGTADLEMPHGLDVDRATGDVLVADRQNGRVQRFTADGVHLMQIGPPGSGEGSLDGPTDVAVDDSGYIYVSEMYGGTISKFDPAGSFVKKWGAPGSADGELSSPWALAVDDSGFVYVADTGNDRVQKFTSDGVFQAKWGTPGSGPGQFNSTRGIAVDASGLVYVSDSDNNTIQKFTSSGIQLGGWGGLGSGDGEFHYAANVAVEDSGYVYVADIGNNRIQKFTSDGTFVTKWGTVGTGDGELQSPNGVAVGESGVIYTTEPFLHRIQKFRWSCP